jgi:hypothetical protein
MQPNVLFMLLAAITKNELLGYQIFQGKKMVADYGSFILSLIGKNEPMHYDF